MYTHEQKLEFQRMTQHSRNDLFSVRLDPRMKADASAILASYGLNLSDAVRMLLTRITIEKRLPQGLVAGKDEYDACFRKRYMKPWHQPAPGIPMKQ